MTETEIIELKKLLDGTPQRIVVVPHKGPDGDAVGSTTAMYDILKQLGHGVTMIAPNDFPQFLKWMPHSENIKIYDKNATDCDAIIDKAQLIFILDHNAYHRSGDMEKILTQSTAPVVMIDHHQQPDDIATFKYSDTSMSSTCQMVYHFMEKLGYTSLLNEHIASNLYTGILTDTGSFKYRSTTPTTMRVAATLMDHGAVAEVINRNIYDTSSLSRLKLLGVALNNLTLIPEYRTAYITLSLTELEKHNFKKGDTEGFVNYALSLEGVVFAQIFMEKKEDGHFIRTSLRSKGDFDVNELARKHWNGGGHKNAAGGKSDLGMDTTVEKLISILPQYKNALHDTVI